MHQEVEDEPPAGNGSSNLMCLEGPLLVLPYHLPSPDALD